MNVNKVSSSISFKAYVNTNNLRIVRHIQRVAKKEEGLKGIIEFLDDSQKEIQKYIDEGSMGKVHQIKADEFKELVAKFRENPKKFLRIVSDTIRNNGWTYPHPKPRAHMDEFNTNLTIEHAIKDRYDIPTYHI